MLAATGNGVLRIRQQIWPEVKRRQYKQALDAYEAAVGRQARVGRGQAADAARAGEGCQVPPE